jgi:hypothetical protein
MAIAIAKVLIYPGGDAVRLDLLPPLEMNGWMDE